MAKVIHLTELGKVTGWCRLCIKCLSQNHTATCLVLWTLVPLNKSMNRLFYRFNSYSLALTMFFYFITHHGEGNRLSGARKNHRSSSTRSRCIVPCPRLPRSRRGGTRRVRQIRSSALCYHGVGSTTSRNPSTRKKTRFIGRCMPR